MPASQMWGAPRSMSVKSQQSLSAPHAVQLPLIHASPLQSWYDEHCPPPPVLSLIHTPPWHTCPLAHWLSVAQGSQVPLAMSQTRP